MTPHWISHIHVEKLWGDKTIAFPLHSDTNIIIGPNASGKTTIINLLMFTLTGDVLKLLDYQFDLINITLKAFDSKKELPVKVTKPKQGIHFEIGGNSISFAEWPEFIKIRRGTVPGIPPEFLRRHFARELLLLRKELEGLVPAAWLPVSRRLPIADEDEDDTRRVRGSLESVDQCLSELLTGLQRYRVSLDVRLSELRKEFQKHALENILYDKRHDKMIDLEKFSAPTQDDKKRLLKAFQDLGFVDSAMELRIEEHFKAGQEAIDLLRKNPHEFTSKTLFIVPLLHRTKQMVEFAQDLETKRQALFAPLALYETTIGSFISGKRIEVLPRGEMRITKEGANDREIEWRHLSSGEKQILILLTQALLWGEKPAVYVADEPELSLHVTWQEKLLKSIIDLTPKSQVIVATHSPDIAGGFPKRIIDLAKYASWL